MVRYLDSVENRNAGKLFNVCRPPIYHVGHESISELIGPKNVPTEYYFSKIVMTRSAYTLEFANLGNSPDYGIADNDCVPTFKNAKHPGYALFNNDIYFDTHADEKALQPTYLLGPSGVTKRWVEGVGLVVARGIQPALPPRRSCKRSFLSRAVLMKPAPVRWRRLKEWFRL